MQILLLLHNQFSRASAGNKRNSDDTKNFDTQVEYLDVCILHFV